MNSIFRDLFATSFKGGLYNKSEFDELNLNKRYKPGDCFLGFMNKKVLNSQMQKLAETLSCYAPDSPTNGPVVAATIKIALDCLIRAIAIKEIMKSLFVYGIFPTELLHDDKISFYDMYINGEISLSLEKLFLSSRMNINNFL